MPPPSDGDPDRVSAPADAAGEAALYADLRVLAASFLRRERPDHTLQPTALVNEAYLRMIGDEPFAGGASPADRSRLRAMAAIAMRRILVDHARRVGAQRRGAGRRITLCRVDDIAARAGPLEVDILALDDALRSLAQRSERQARIVELRWFGGLAVEEIALVIGLSDRTVKQDWRVAKAWLRRELSRGADP